MVCYDIFHRPPSELSADQIKDMLSFVALLEVEAEERADPSGQRSSLMRDGI